MERGKTRLAISSLVFVFKKLWTLFYFFHNTSLHCTMKCVMVLPVPSPSPLLKWQKCDIGGCRAEPWPRTVVPPPPLGPVVAAAEPLPRFAESPCSCGPTAVISAVFPLKISMSFALNLAGDRVKRKIQLEGSRDGSSSLHGWALNTCNSDTSVSCGLKAVSHLWRLRCCSCGKRTEILFPWSGYWEGGCKDGKKYMSR